MLRPVWEKLRDEADTVVVFHCVSGMVRSAALGPTKLGGDTLGSLPKGIFSQWEVVNPTFSGLNHRTSLAHRVGEWSVPGLLGDFFLALPNNN